MTVVVRRTSFTPTDAIVGYPGLWLPKVDTINISCVFTWDKPEASRVAEAWKASGYKVNLGGPAFDDPGGEFTPGKFIRAGVTITSRGCIRNCPFCYVPKREGKIRHLEIKAGNIVNDNNLLACNRAHIERVFDMLKTQRAIEFKGGIDARLLKPWHIDAMRGLKIREIWTASDGIEYLSTATAAIRALSAAGFSRNKIRCYVLIGYGGEEQAYAEYRLREVFCAGSLPFAQLYDGFTPTKEWKQFARTWSRPALTKREVEADR
jgi:hypothetical protein